MRDNSAILIIADSERDSNMFYATGFMAPDPFVFIQRKNERVIAVGDLELDRAKSQSKVDQVLPLSKYEKIIKKKDRNTPKLIEVALAILRELNVKRLSVPSNFNVSYADFLRKRGLELKVKEEPFFNSREIKNEQEVEYIVKVLRTTEIALDKAISYIKKSTVKNSCLYARDGRQLTSELLRKMIDVELMKRGCAAKHTIVSCGEQSCGPHNVGNGPLMANESIIFDVFPKDEQTGYYADISRTIVKGKASAQLRKMYRAVASAQKTAFKPAKNGAKGNIIHGKVVSHLKSLGFKTGKQNGKMKGFFHGTGHGVGLDVHETPRISKVKCTLKTGNVITVEPGLYYPGIGGVRLEDMILITEDGCKILTEFPKVLEV